MPAAAVIPAPTAYTFIAAVKTLVVCLRDAGPSRASTPPSVLRRPPVGRAVRRRGRRWAQPRRYVPAPMSLECSAVFGSCSKPPSLGAQAESPATLARTLHRGRRPSFVRAAQLAPRVLHRSPPSDDTLENSVCSKHPYRTAECLSMECRSNDQSLGTERVVLVLEPAQGILGRAPGVLPSGALPPPGRAAARAEDHGPACRDCLSPSTKRGLVPRAPRSLRPASSPPGAPGALARPPACTPPNGTDGTARGEGYLSARGEILRSL